MKNNICYIYSKVGHHVPILHDMLATHSLYQSFVKCTLYCNILLNITVRSIQTHEELFISSLIVRTSQRIS